jgi:aminoglycoside phosphotransferase (APT) family kinase protein
MSSKAEEQTQFEQVAQRIEPNSKLLRIWQPAGGISAFIRGFEVERQDGHVIKMILRQHGEVDLKSNPHIARDEFRLLSLLYAVGIPVPLPIHLDQSCQIFTTPCLVTGYIEGVTDFTPSNLDDYLLKLAEGMAKIHQVNLSYGDLSFLPSYPQKFSQAFEEGTGSLSSTVLRIHMLLESNWPLPLRNNQALLHGDYWPGNILWKDGEIVGVIDWEDAKIGDPLADLANTRLELFWAFGKGAMDSFTNHYRSILGEINLTVLPYWDLYMACKAASKIARWGLEKGEEKRKREELNLFTNQAFEKLSGL